MFFILNIFKIGKEVASAFADVFMTEKGKGAMKRALVGDLKKVCSPPFVSCITFKIAVTFYSGDLWHGPIKFT